MTNSTDQVSKKDRELWREWLGSHGLPHNEVEGDLILDFIEAVITSKVNQARIMGGLDKPSPMQTSAATKPLTFVVYRTEAKNVVEAHEQSNYLDADQVQFEGVEFWDGTVAIRWRTPTTSMSFWDSMESLKKVHIYAHPDYGTRVEWSDGKVEQL
jgi:hypothetical protein